jgi:hypothetical protein
MYDRRGERAGLETAGIEHQAVGKDLHDIRRTVVVEVGHRARSARAERGSVGGNSASLEPTVATGDQQSHAVAGTGLAKIGDASSADLLIKAANVEPGWERIQATKNCMVLAEKLAAASRQSESQKIYKYLRDTRKDASEKYIRDAADAALA